VCASIAATLAITTTSAKEAALMARPTLPHFVLHCARCTAPILACAITLASGCLDRPVVPAVPTVSARIVENPKQSKVSKIDLLFMIDNSSSMADKQQILKLAVPDLVERLVNPICVDPQNGNAPAGAADGQGKCGAGLDRDFDPVTDIHIGVISSSLGGHGSDQCPPGQMRDDDKTKTRDNDDRAHLLARGATVVAGGFLNFNPAQAGALKTAEEVKAPFQSMVLGVGQFGCGYEAQLESIYRFLNDPEPYASITGGNYATIVGASVAPRAHLVGKDDALLQQRADFLRPDSLVAIMMVTDENDCSIADLENQQNFYPLVAAQNETTVLKHGTSACHSNPNDRCCVNCLETPPEGCMATKDDPACAAGLLKKDEDPPNMRCFDQKRRYGKDFLFSPSRYVEAFTRPVLTAYRGDPAPNPLFGDLKCKNEVGCAPPRDPELVFVAGIVGVPWQDIARDPANLKRGFKVAAEIDWHKILGDPHNASGPILPTDPHMVESVAPRNTASNGLKGLTEAADADPINGHEWDTSKWSTPHGDLQFACIFELPTPRDCATETGNCDCSPPMLAPSATTPPPTSSPLCQQGNTFSTTQYRAKAYPGLRELEVLKGIGNQAIVASICPAEVKDEHAPEYGYRPAIEALINRLRIALRGSCLPRQLEIDKVTQQVPCVIVESYRQTNGACDCTLPGRKPAPDDVLTDQIVDAGNCHCVIEQLEGKDQDTCRKIKDAPGSSVGGWCYIDPGQKAGSCDLVKDCSPSERRLIQFANHPSEPRAGATAFIMCQERSFSASGEDVPVDPCAKK
jgi:hypothetical protein